MKEKGILIKAKSSCYEEGSQENLWFCPERKGHKWGRKIRWHNWNPQMWRCREHRAIDQCVLCSEPCWPLGCQCTTTAPSGLGQLFAEAFCYLRVMLARAMKRCKLPEQHSSSCKSLQWETPSGSLLCIWRVVQKEDTEIHVGRQQRAGMSKL